MYTQAYVHNRSGESWCYTCGKSHQQDHAAIALVDGEPPDTPQAPIPTAGDRVHALGHVCRECAISPHVAAARAREHAAELRARADGLDALAKALPATTCWATQEDLDEAKAEFYRHYLRGTIGAGEPWC